MKYVEVLEAEVHPSQELLQQVALQAITRRDSVLPMAPSRATGSAHEGHALDAIPDTAGSLTRTVIANRLLGIFGCR